jgi:Cu-Zn family superoxide dismutase
MGKNIIIFFTLLIVAIQVSCKKNDFPLADEYPLSSEDSFPEGVTFDPIDRAFYAGSLNGSTITRIYADGTESVFLDLDSEVSFTGMKVDADNRRLWVCAGLVDPIIPQGEEGSWFGEIWIFDLVSKEKTHAYPLTDIVPNTNGRCNDFIIDENGIGYIPDSHQPHIYRIDPDEDAATLFALDAILETECPFPASTCFFIPGSNGVVITPDARFLLIANTYASTLFRVSLEDPSDIIEVTLGGDDFTFPDGLVMFDQTLYGVSSEKIHQVTFTDTSFDEATVQSIEFIGGTTTGTLAENQLYVIKSLKTGEDDTDLPFKIVKVDLSLFDAT